MSLTILEMAANVREKSQELDTACGELRRVGAEWSGFSVAREDALRIADDGLRNCWTVLEKLRCLAIDELRKGQKSTTKHGRL